MDMLDQALEASHEDTKDSTGSDDVQLTGDGEEGIGTVQNVASSQITLDPNLQYQLRTDTGQVTYRVVQVTDGTESAQVVATNAFQPGAQAVIQSPFSNGGSPTPDNQATETRFTYFPTTVVTNADQVTSQGDVSGTSAALGQVTAAGGAWATGETALQQGQFYVMMSPQEVLQGQRNIAPRTGFTPKVEGVRTGRDDRRRATHNEVERRRRDKINNWIVQLSKVIPDCSQEHTKQGQSKGGILSKACDYITELKTANLRMSESLKETERLSVDLELLRQQCEELKSENSILRAQLQSHGLIPDIPGSNS